MRQKKKEIIKIATLKEFKLVTKEVFGWEILELAQRSEN